MAGIQVKHDLSLQQCQYFFIWWWQSIRAECPPLLPLSVPNKNDSWAQHNEAFSPPYPEEKQNFKQQSEGLNLSVDKLTHACLKEGLNYTIHTQMLQKTTI